MNGVSNAYIGSQAALLPFDDSTVGYLSLTNTVCSLIGGIIVGPLLDTLAIFKQKNLKMLILLLSMAIFISFILTTLALDPPW